MKPEKLAKPDTPSRADVDPRRTAAAISFFGDLHPSFAGNVVKAMGSAKQGYPVVSRMLARRAAAAPAPAELVARLNDELRAVVHEVIRLTPNIVEVVVRAPHGGPRLRARPVLSPAELRNARAARRRHHARDGRPRAHRRVGRSREGSALDHRARNGRLVRSVRAAEAGRARDPDGSDRHADRNAREGDRAAGRRRTRQRRAVLHRPAACAPTARAWSTSPATRR